MIGIKNSRNNSHCKLNLRMDGVDNGTSFVDSSPNTKTITVSNAVTKTAVKKFGTASGYFNGSNAYLSLADNNDFLLDKIVVVDFWLYLTQLPSVAGIPMKILDKDLGTTGNRVWTIQIHDSSPVANSLKINFFDASDNNRTWNVNGYAVSADVNTWVHHLYIINQPSDYVRVYKNGISQITNVAGTNTGVPKKASVDVRVGARGTTPPSHYLYGYIDSMLWRKGVSDITRNFKVPNRTA